MMHPSSLYDSAKTACFGKTFSQVINENALGNQIARFFF